MTGLLLNDMRLSAKEIEEIGSLPSLRHLVLFRTNFQDTDLRHVRRCTRLEHLNLSGAEITDAAIDHILELKQLNSLCLGNVDISAEAIAKLKNGFQSRGQIVKLGYSGREREK